MCWKHKCGCCAVTQLQSDKAFSLLTPELNPFAQRCLPWFFTWILIFKGLIARRLCKSFGVKGLTLRVIADNVVRFIIL
jgi:hypothetical protein